MLVVTLKDGVAFHYFSAIKMSFATLVQSLGVVLYVLVSVRVPVVTR